MSAYDMARILLRPPLRRGLGWRVEGLEHIPLAGPALVAANHISLLDPLAVGYLVDRRGREARFLATSGLFRYPVLAGFLRRMGHIPVERATSRAAASLDPAAGALGAGEVVVIFPEGGLSSDLDPSRGHTGVARLARAAGVPVITVGLWGTHRLHARNHWPRWRPRLVVAAAIGAGMGVLPDEDDRAATDRIMDTIAGQVATARLLYAQQTPPGEDAWWVRHRRMAAKRMSIEPG
ncbi:MAG: 1-acyl-sn-glycerol-3-phosphate acyltransferase [Actinomycetota bacterium]|nr:1-acyl-sn-glycerol-3-phosphate acyltransferase [Actinomycetota bacterium]